MTFMAAADWRSQREARDGKSASTRKRPNSCLPREEICKDTNEIAISGKTCNQNPRLVEGIAKNAEEETQK